MAENIRLLWILWMSVRIHLSAAVPQINCTAEQPVEGKPYQLFCTGINAAGKVEWRRSFQSGGGDGVVASCDDVSICTVIDNTQHGVSRPTANTSSLTILRIQRNDDTRWTWTCLSGGQSSSCNLPPTIYLPELSTNCTAELTLGGPVARCLIQKVYPVPECTWLESTTPSSGAGESNTTILPSSSEVQLEALASFHTADGNLYFSATCVLRRVVTYIEGNYSYTAIVSPGSVSRIVKFAGRSSIAAPSTPALVDCGSGYIPPSQEVVCTCRVSDLGWPRGHVMWTDQSGNVIRTGQNTSVQLVRGDVPEPKSTNRTYTCQVRSSDNFIHSTDYVPFFAFGPDTVRVTGPNTLIADDHSSVTLTCTAYGVNPQPFFIWQGQGQDFLVSSVSGGDEPQSYQESMSFVPRLTEKSAVVTCFVRNSHFNLSYVSNSSFTIPFIMKNCSDSGGASEIKERSSQDVTAVGASLGAVCVLLILVCIGVILCWRRKTNLKQTFNDQAKEPMQMQEIDRPTGLHKGQGSARRQGPSSAAGSLGSHRATGGQRDQSFTEPADGSYDHLYDTADEVGYTVRPAPAVNDVVFSRSSPGTSHYLAYIPIATSAYGHRCCSVLHAPRSPGSGNKRVSRQLEDASKDKKYVDMSATGQAASGGVRQNASTAQPQDSSARTAPGGQGGQRQGSAALASPGPHYNRAQTPSTANENTYLIPVQALDADSQVYVGPDSIPEANSNRTSSPLLPPLPKLPLPPTRTETTTATSSEHPPTTSSELSDLPPTPCRPGAQPEGSMSADLSLDDSSTHQTLQKTT